MSRLRSVMRRSFIAALVLVVCTVGVPAVARCQQQGPTPQQKEEFRQRLGMTHEQAAKMEALHHQAFQEEHELRDRMSKVTADLHALYDQYVFDRGEAARLKKELADLYSQRLELHERLQTETRKILNEQQYARLVKVVREFTKEHPPRFRGHGPGPPPPEHL